MNSREIRQTFLDFFASKQHHIVPSAPIVVKNDPTLMFVNSGMAPFKDIFLGISPVKYPRIADTQKCLRVSGKHNDLEEVGIDTYHHTLFEMLGNWSFGDYFKKEAITWAWELLTDVYKIDKDRLYVTVFEGDEKEKLEKDQEAYDIWKQFIAENRIINGNKKDNFWEMGDTGPCGPCSEIHIDLRPDEERARIDGKSLVNKDHPQVVEIWNNVFMQFQRMANGSLVSLPAKHVDTGMGFERLCMALQEKTSNYDTDVFQPLIQFIAKESGFPYVADATRGPELSRSIAMRVMADHIRAIAFTITDGQLPSNTGAGYVIRRILRRAVRYAYTYLNFKEPFLYKLTDILAEQFAGVFNEIVEQKEFVKKVIMEEESSFLRTLATGIQRFEKYESANGKIDGTFAFELFDTYGFPIDLTQLMASEKGWSVDIDGFNKSLEEQKSRSRAATAVDTEDWIDVHPGEQTVFLGYDQLKVEAKIIKYRKVKSKNKEQYQLVLDQTPFYAESGGQVGDTGMLVPGDSTTSWHDFKSCHEVVLSGAIRITDTKKENNQVIHFTDQIPVDVSANFMAVVDEHKRLLTENNHSATHLLHAALKQVLGQHVNQKGSLVNDEYLRFDFSHFAKLTDEELTRIEGVVNQKIMEQIPLKEQRNVPYQQAIDSGVTALFGEKYGDFVRVITFDDQYSKELCGGTHVKNTAQIGLFKITSESAVAAGVRRIEAITSAKALEFYNSELALLNDVRNSLKNPPDVKRSVEQLLEEHTKLKKELEQFYTEKASVIRQTILSNLKEQNGMRFYIGTLALPSADLIKNLAFELKQQVDNLFLVLGAEIDGKPHLAVMISEGIVAEKNLNASAIVRELGKEIQGGGGGQAFFATAGGKNIAGLPAALSKASTYIG